MRDREGRAGYALLAVLFVAAVAAVVLAACVAALGAHQGVAAADRASAAATDGVRAGLHDVCDALRWSPWSQAGALEPTTEAGRDWSAEWRAAARGVSGWPTLTLDVTSRVGLARRLLAATVQLRSEPFVGGVVVGGDTRLSAALAIAGGGLYGGGSLSGREWLTFEGLAVGAPAIDSVHPELWPLAAAHVGGTIWARDSEIHGTGADGLDGSWALDGDVHTEAADLTELVRGPAALLVQAMEEHGDTRVDDGLGDGVDLGRLPTTPPEGSAAGPGAGYIVVLRSEAGQCVDIVGQRQPGACPLVLVIDGDAAVGATGSDETVSSGALIVTGHLLVAGSLHHIGHVYAGNLEIAAPTRIETPSSWRSELPPGLAAPVVISLTDGES